MPAFHSISSEKLARLVGLPSAPLIVDLREAPAIAIPGSVFRDAAKPLRWAAQLAGAVVLVDDHGASAPAIAATLRSEGIAAEVLENGFAGWVADELPTVSLARLPPRHDDGRTWWVTRARPKVDRIACPWFIRRFVDPEARFLYVAPADVLTTAEQLGVEPFDVSDDRVFWSHRDDRCTFDVMIEACGLQNHAPLAYLADIVRGADTDRLDVAPEAAGLLAISLGLSRNRSDDHEQLEAGMAVYDALYRWCRDARDEKHNWTSHQPARARVSS
jgi:rhodanese-related sulfurtransferase